MASSSSAHKIDPNTLLISAYCPGPWGLNRTAVTSAEKSARIIRLPHSKCPLTRGGRRARMSKAGGRDSKNTLYCSFCGKSQHEVRKLVAGPTVFVCDECVELCVD